MQPRCSGLGALILCGGPQVSRVRFVFTAGSGHVLLFALYGNWILLYFYILFCEHGGGGTGICGLCAPLLVEVRTTCRSQVFSSRRVSHGDRAQAVGFSGQCLYPLSHLAHPGFIFKSATESLAW